MHYPFDWKESVAKQSNASLTLVGPFRQLVTMRGLPKRGPLKDEQLEVIPEGGILLNAWQIDDIGHWETLRKENAGLRVSEIYLDEDLVALPGFIDAHTHICFAGSRASDYAARNNGKGYLEIASEGGGIWSTVTQTRAASQEALAELLRRRVQKLLQSGVTTVEVKSGYGLSVKQELKLIKAILEVKHHHSINIIATCLAAHIKPMDFAGDEIGYLQLLLDELVPVVRAENLCKRFDIFVEQSAFDASSAKHYLSALKRAGFQLTVHGDQFTTGGSQLAIDVGALSVDHLEASGEKEVAALAQSQVIPVVLPGASLGLGSGFAPARKFLDKGCSLAIASDWNPGSAPQGNLLSQAAILGAFEKLSMAETLAGITCRAASALALQDIGILEKGFIADFIAFPCMDFREVLYHQGELKAKRVWKSGKNVI